ncbi:MAG: hypothetical protein IJS32_09565 [Kiritimatiellae bacterium]|nr:hypothetical protein [Kiritimatiellia bacterium]
MESNATMKWMLAWGTGFLLAAFVALADEIPPYYVHCGPYNPAWADEGCPPPPEWVEIHSHFLLADGPGELEMPLEDWEAKVESRDALLAELEAANGLSEAWNDAWAEAASWHYPKGGGLAAARLYFGKKAAWMQRMLQNPVWARDPDHLDAVAGFLGEIREWRFPIGELWLEDRPGQGVLLKAGVESPDDLPDEAARAAYRKAVDDDARKKELEKLQRTLMEEGNRLLFETWRQCNRALRMAERTGDGEGRFRLADLQTRLLACAEEPETLLNDTDAVGFVFTSPKCHLGGNPDAPQQEDEP